MVSYEAVVFDMDGVLFDTETVSKKGWIKTAQEMGIPDIEESLKNCTGVTEPAMRAYLTGRYGSDFPYEAFRARTSALFQETIEREGVRLMPGVKEILDFLKAQGKAIALASSSRMQSIMHHLDAHGMAHYFDAILSGDQVQNGKPDPEIYLKACAALGKEPCRCIALEDSLNGIRAAHGAGMMAVMVPDQIAPTDEIRALTYAIRDSLWDVRYWLAAPDEREEWALYDENGVRTGETILRGEPVPPGRYHAVVETFVRHADGDYLLMRRDARKIGCPGLWDCGAGGGVKSGEDFEAAARRELQEETGLREGALRKIGSQTDGHMLLTFYLFVTDAPKDAVTLQKGETDAWRWVTQEELEALAGTPACVPFLKKRWMQFKEELRQ